MKRIKGNLLDVERGILVHQVNTLGVMGAGLAAQIKAKWPHVFDAYYSACQEGLKLGTVQFVPVNAEESLWVANLAGQETLGGVATRYDAYPDALSEIGRLAALHDLPVYLPYGIGCGLAGGNWEIMEPLLEFYLPEATVVYFFQKEASSSGE